MTEKKPGLRILLKVLKPIIKRTIKLIVKKKLRGGLSFAEITAKQEEDGASGKAVMPKMKPWMKRLWVKLKPIVIETIKKVLKQMLAGDSLTETTAHQEEDDAAGKTIMTEKKPGLRILLKVLKPIIKRLIKRIVKKKLRGGLSFAEITAKQEEDDAAGK